ncbi:Tripartite tricarboxylate transporter family receptor [Hartmannibacter diazotrophicus]|uniref:Tripartite tricarboxylate transporter family receptor n=1 Tax=Hartmannibacter diazotrophicus TaxID=1482074 RepID=A0A2C9DC73_9HYPH|nr:tripartite tricarboxylate transporter substrate-binding protein [Hartmannibacter diazotrophicus]SON57779.1 Tripartite tricarboxylate transporter family receptor [Hartmannibacter diazotrophicus]
MNSQLGKWTTAIAAMGAGLWITAALAGPGEDFYNGKTVTYVVATKPGGGYDTNGRLVAQYMQKYLPGSTFVVQNMPGAGHLIGANYIYNSEPDGLTLGTFNTGLIYSQIKGDPAIKFDLTKMSWIGKVASDPRVVVVSTESGIKSFEDLMALKEPIKFASAGAGSASTIETTLLVDSLKMPVRIITGYNGGDDQLAIMRGEVQGIVGSRSSFQQFVDEGHARFIAQVGGSETDVPQLSTFVTTDAGRKAVALVASQAQLSRFTAGPPGIEEDRLTALRNAYASATTDPEFLAKAKELGLPIDPAVGDGVQKAVVEALDQTPETVDFLKKALTDE